MGNTTTNTVEIRANSLAETTVIKTIEMYLKNGYEIKSAKWSSEEERYVVVLAK